MERRWLITQYNENKEIYRMVQKFFETRCLKTWRSCQVILAPPCIVSFKSDLDTNRTNTGILQTLMQTQLYWHGVHPDGTQSLTHIRYVFTSDLRASCYQLTDYTTFFSHAAVRAENTMMVLIFVLINQRDATLLMNDLHYSLKEPCVLYIGRA